MSESKNDAIVNNDSALLAVNAATIRIKTAKKPSETKIIEYSPKELSIHKIQIKQYGRELTNLYKQVKKGDIYNNIQMLKDSNQEGFNRLSVEYNALKQELKNQSHVYHRYYNSIKNNSINIQLDHLQTIVDLTLQLEKSVKMLTLSIQNETAKNLGKDADAVKSTNNQLSEIILHPQETSNNTSNILVEMADTIVNTTKQKLADLSDIIIPKDIDTAITDIQIKASTDYVLTSDATGEIIPPKASSIPETTPVFLDNISEAIQRLSEGVDKSIEQITQYPQKNLKKEADFAKAELEKNQVSYNDMLVIINMLQKQIAAQLTPFAKANIPGASEINQYLDGVNELEKAALELGTYNPATSIEVQKISSAAAEQFRILNTNAKILFKKHADTLNKSINEQLDEFSKLSNFREKRDELTSYLQEQIKLFNASEFDPIAFETIDKNVQHKLANLIVIFKDEEVDFGWKKLHNFTFPERDLPAPDHADSNLLFNQIIDLKGKLNKNNSVISDVSKATSGVSNQERKPLSKEEQWISNIVLKFIQYNEVPFVQKMISELEAIKPSDMNSNKNKIDFYQKALTVLERNITEENLSILSPADEEPFIDFIRACLKPLNDLIKNLTGKKYSPQLFGATQKEAGVAETAQKAHSQLHSLMQTLDSRPPKSSNVLNSFILK